MPSKPRTSGKTRKSPGKKKSPQGARKRSTTKKTGPGLEERLAGMLTDIQETLEYQLADKTATVLVQGKLLTLKKWGLRKKLTLGSRVTQIVERARLLLPAGANLGDAGTMTTILGTVAEDIMAIVAQSFSDPFKSPAEALDWMDEHCGMDDIFNLAVLVWDMNLKDAESLGKMTEGLERMTARLESLGLNPTSRK
jgi:hypothetical protein